MAEPRDPRDDEHIEELLSQLQGIFGKLSHAEEEESREKIDPPAKSEPTASAAPPVETKPPAPEPEPPPVTVPEHAPPVQETAAEPPAAPNPEPSAAESPTPAQTGEKPVVETTEITPEMMADKSIIFAIVCYPMGRDADVKTLGMKLETMAPKFTKVAFQLKVAMYVPYNPKSEWPDMVLSKITDGSVRALFIMVERPMDEPRRKAMTAALESRGIYFQEVPVAAVEKKAFYTDLLLGMVFFFDSLKQAGQDASRMKADRHQGGFMDKTELKRRLPTFIGYWEKRQKAARNRLPKHLRPPARWPIVVQMILNLTIFIALMTLIMNKDEYVTDAGPAITMVLCLMGLIYTVINGFRMRTDYAGTHGARLAKLNFWLMAAAFLSWPIAVAVFMP